MNTIEHNRRESLKQEISYRDRIILFYDLSYIVE